VATVDDAAFQCTRCKHDSTPGSQIAGHADGQTYRICQCESCGKVDLRELRALDPDEEPPPQL
jgi:hypothetical protein